MLTKSAHYRATETNHGIDGLSIQLSGRDSETRGRKEFTVLLRYVTLNHGSFKECDSAQPSSLTTPSRMCVLCISQWSHQNEYGLSHDENDAEEVLS